MMSPGSAQFADFKFYPVSLNYPALSLTHSPGDWAVLFYWKASQQRLVQSLEVCLFLPGTFHSQSHPQLITRQSTAKWSGESKQNCKPGGACLHLHVCVGKRCVH